MMPPPLGSRTGRAGDLYCPTCERTYGEGDRCPSDATRLVRLVSAVDPFLGRELDGRYTIVEKLGQGGMGTVYRAHQHSVGRDVAVKVVTPGLVSSPDVIKRFLRECKLASRLAHPNAVGVLDFGQTDDGVFFLVMELVAGRTLDEVMAHERPLRPERVIRIGVQICDALEGAHGMSIVHRDLKPSNVMLLATGRDLVKVLDFGLAKSLSPDSAQSTMTGTGALMGTPAYMPPELARGQECDGRADLYSLGCILYYLASGRPPFVSDSVHELVMMHASEPAPPMAGPPALATVVDRLLLKEPDQRYPSAASTREALEHALAHLHAKPAPPAAPADTEISLGPFPATTEQFAFLKSEPGVEPEAAPRTPVRRARSSTEERLAVLDTFAGDAAAGAGDELAASAGDPRPGDVRAASADAAGGRDEVAATSTPAPDVDAAAGKKRLLVRALVVAVAAAAVAIVVIAGSGRRRGDERAPHPPPAGGPMTGNEPGAALDAGPSADAATAAVVAPATALDAGAESGSAIVHRLGSGGGSRPTRSERDAGVGTASGSGGGGATSGGAATGTGTGTAAGSAGSAGSGGSGKPGSDTGSGGGSRTPGSPDQDTPPF